ncbi:hypothetical protein C0030_004465 [Candidatus Liberibacter solanacearum]|uniref:Uncharacterized protein n=1 Tax=Candidatus Liberibacter solanacearum TaxID=556287 RepID=A0A424FLC5_9HYPH|nr:hypothetical protein C0030_004465 [Candidatus Liberibacter solanacearum]
MCIWGLMFRIILFLWNQIGNLLLFSMGLRFRYVMDKILKNKIFSADPFLSRDQLFILKILYRSQKTIQKK